MAEARVIAGSAAWPAEGPRPVITIGNFDGVHRGHLALLERTLELSGQLGATPTAFTFHPAPRDVLRPDNPIRRIQTLDDRLHHLGAEGMEHIVLEPFSREYAAHDAEWFAREVLGHRLRAAAVVVGWDFRFGRGRGGSVDTLRAVLDVPIEQVDARMDGEEPISSSRIRRCIAAGDLVEAARLLGRPHTLVGTVVHGDGRGADLGFPTANIQVQTDLCPPSGVYAVRCRVAGQSVPGVANLGVRPTFEGQTAPEVRLEVHLLDFDADLYGEGVRIALIDRLREERRFENVDALVRQIRQDVEHARAALA